MKTIQCVQKSTVNDYYEIVESSHLLPLYIDVKMLKDIFGIEDIYLAQNPTLDNSIYTYLEINLYHLYLHI